MRNSFKDILTIIVSPNSNPVTTNYNEINTL